MLLGGLSAGALTGCDPSQPTTHAAVRVTSVYTNNHYVPGVGYYHAPYRAWYPLPYNHFDAQTGRYFHGGQWAAAPHLSITNLSEPTETVAQQVQAQRTDVRRGGFGSTSHFGRSYFS